MKTNPKSRNILIKSAVIAAIGVSPSICSAALVLKYDFNNLPDTIQGGESVTNSAPGASVNGTTVKPSGTVFDVVSNITRTTTNGGPLLNFGKAIKINTNQNTLAGTSAAHIDTGIITSDLGISPATTYTAMAWINLDPTVANDPSGDRDNMIFGGARSTDPQRVLHLGSRRNQTLNKQAYHSGHWADDVGPTAAELPVNTWKHVAYTNTTSGTQSIYVDGVLIQTGGVGTGGQMDTTVNLLIGTAGNSGSFNGLIDEIKVFDEVLTAEQIMAQMNAGIPLATAPQLLTTQLTTSNVTFTILDSSSVIISPTNPVVSANVSIDDGPNSPLVVTSTSKNGSTTTITCAIQPKALASHKFTLSLRNNSGNVISPSLSSTVTGPFLPVAGIPEPALPTTPGRWALRAYKGATDLNGIGSALSYLNSLTANPPDPSTVVNDDAPVINHSDPETNSGPANNGNFNNDLPLISNTVGTPDDNIVHVGKLRLAIANPGDYTFSVHSDDGFVLNITGLGGASGRFISSSGSGLIDPVNSQSIGFLNNTGDSNTRGVYKFDTAGSYEVTFLHYEKDFGAYMEIAWAPGAFVEDKNTTSWQLLGTPNDPEVTAIPYQPRWPAIPTSVFNPSGNGTWGVRVYREVTGIENINQLMQWITSSNPQTASAVDEQLQSINFHDPDASGGFPTTGILPGETPFPGNNSGSDDNNLVVTATAKLNIVVGGDYTFNFHSDDGFLFRIFRNGVPVPFKGASGSPISVLSVSNPNEVFYPDGTGDSNTRAVINLTPGIYEVQYVQWEGISGFYSEISAAYGSFVNDSDTTSWRAVGALPPASVPLSKIQLLAPGWTVRGTKPNTEGFSIRTGSDIFDTINSIFDNDPSNNPSPSPDVIGPQNYNAINFVDPEQVGFGKNGDNQPFLGNTNAADDHHALEITGVIKITEAGDYALGFSGDDGSSLRIEAAPGQSFTPVFANPGEDENAYLFRLDDGVAITESELTPGVPIRNTLSITRGSANCTTLAKINLQPGNYKITAIFFELTGNSAYEIVGGKYSTYNKSDFNTDTIMPLIEIGGPPIANPLFITLVTDRATIPVKAVSGTLTPLAVNITFDSVSGQTYTVQASPNLQTGQWSNIGTVNATGSSTSITIGNGKTISDTLPAGATARFYRIIIP